MLQLNADSRQETRTSRRTAISPASQKWRHRGGRMNPTYIINNYIQQVVVDWYEAYGMLKAERIQQKYRPF